MIQPPGEAGMCTPYGMSVSGRPMGSINFRPSFPPAQDGISTLQVVVGIERSLCPLLSLKLARPREAMSKKARKGVLPTE